MSALVAITTGNLTSSSTWLVDDATSRLLSTSTSSTALTTTAQDSASFTPGAITITGILLKLASRAGSAPTNTLTVTLRDSTGATDIATVVINVSDLPSCSTTLAEGGWLFAKFSIPVTLTAGHAYVVRCLLSSTSTAVSLYTNGTAHNWQRVLATNTNQAPAAGDDMFIAPIYSATTNPATKSTVTVTMDSTSATDYGSAVTGAVQPALSVSDGCALTFGTAASTDYILQVSGSVFIYDNGTFNIGNTGTPIPRGSTATLQLDCAVADLDYKLFVKNGGTLTMQGQSRTSGKSISQTLLTADVAATGTALTVADDTGWLSGDEVVIASTDQTASHSEVAILSANATSSGLTTGALTNSHRGNTASGIQAEVVLLTRNVIFKSTSTTFMTSIDVVGSVDADWVCFRNVGTSTVGGINLSSSISSSGTLSLNQCILRDSDGEAIDLGGAFGTTSSSVYTFVDLNEVHIYNAFQSGGNGACFSCNPGLGGSSGQGTAITIGNMTIICLNAASLVRSMDLNPTDEWNSGASGPIKFTGTIRISGGFYGVEVSGSSRNQGYTRGNFVIHSTGSRGMFLNGTSNFSNLRFSQIIAYHNNNIGISLESGCNNIKFDGPVICMGNNTLGIMLSGIAKLRIKDLRCYGTTDFAQPYGLYMQATGQDSDIRIEKYTAGVASGLLTTHSTADFNVNSSPDFDVVIIDATLASSTTVSGLVYLSTLNGSGSQEILRIQNLNGQGFWASCATGIIQAETTTVDISPSVKMTPKILGTFDPTFQKLETNLNIRGKGFLVPVASGTTLTPSVKVQKDGAYTGNAPRLVLKANPDIGVTDDVVLATHSAASGTWQTLSGTTPSATANGIMEFVVDCDGNAGNIYVDTWTQTGAASLTDAFYVDGLPFNVIGGGSGSSSPVTISRPFIGL